MNISWKSVIVVLFGLISSAISQCPRTCQDVPSSPVCAHLDTQREKCFKTFDNECLMKQANCQSVLNPNRYRKILNGKCENCACLKQDMCVPKCEMTTCTTIIGQICAGRVICSRAFVDPCELQKWNCLNENNMYTFLHIGPCNASDPPPCQPES